GLERRVVGLHENAVLVLHGGERHAVALGVRIFHVTDRALDPLDVRGDPFVALAADAFRPRNGGGAAHFRLPLVAGLRQIVGPYERGARTVRAPHDGYRLVGQLQTGVERNDGLVVPLLDLAEV